jgi:hypothetical protein
MPAAAASRVNTDIAELNVLDTTPVLPGQPTDTDEPPKRLENGKPRRWAEFGCAASTVFFISLVMVPRQLKKGQMWYTVAHSLNLAAAIVLVVSLFWGNTHIKMIRFLSGKQIFVQVVILALIDWLRVMIMPDSGWEVTDRIYITSTLITRLAYICVDSLKGMSRWFRLFYAFMFMLGNVFTVFAAYFLDEARASSI